MNRLSLIAAAVFLLALSACGDNGSGSSTTADSTTTTNTAAPPSNGDMNPTAPDRGTVSDSNGSTRTPGEDTSAIHQNTSQPGTLRSDGGH